MAKAMKSTHKAHAAKAVMHAKKAAMHAGKAAMFAMKSKSSMGAASKPAAGKMVM